MEKLKMYSRDQVEANLDKLADLFPGCVMEARDETTGRVVRAVDFDRLRQEFAGRSIDGPSERYLIDWPGKREALLASNAPVAKTLRPIIGESVDFAKTQHLFIEGDNLDALKLLQEAYLGKIKLAYMDPPYNTGNDFLYDDDFKSAVGDYLLQSQQVDDIGNRLVANTSSNGRFHSDWLSMMYSRLRLVRNVLHEDGIVLISIDDGELANLRRICDEVFGANRFIATLIWKSRQNKDNRSKTGVSVDHEYVLAYGKSVRGADRDVSGYANPDNDPRGPWTSANMVGLAAADKRPNLHYELTHPDTGVNYGCPTMGWRYDRVTMARLMNEGRIIWPRDAGGRPRRKSFLSELSSEQTGYSSLIGQDIYTRHGTSDVEALFGKRVMDFPKPTALLEELIVQSGVGPGDIVLDIFAGSSTTAHAVLKLNAADGVDRRFVMIQIPQECSADSEAFRAGYETIAAMSKERIRRAGNSIRAGETNGNWNGDVGFRVLKVDSSNLVDSFYLPDETVQAQLALASDNVKKDRSAEDLLFQVLVDWGVDLALPIERRIVLDRTVFLVDGNALVACFETGVDEALVRELAKLRPLRAVFRDGGYASDSTKINVEQIFKLLSPETEVRSL